MQHKIAGAAVGCTLGLCLFGGNGWSEEVNLPAKVVTLTSANADSKVEIALGTELRVKLHAQLGAGYSWTVDSSSTDTLTAVPSSVEPGSSQPGGLETQVLIFKATHPGQGPLKLRYGRPWVKEAPAAKMFVLCVTVLANS